MLQLLLYVNWTRDNWNPFLCANCSPGFNEKGLAGNLLAFPEADYGDPSRGGRPKLSAMLLLQYALDNYASVAEAVSKACSPVQWRESLVGLGQGVQPLLGLAGAKTCGPESLYPYSGPLAEPRQFGRRSIALLHFLSYPFLRLGCCADPDRCITCRW